MINRGAEAENLAFEYLLDQGLQAIERNYRCRQGEIDLIMRDGETIVFVEVRMRTSRSFGGAHESIDTRKQRKILNAARHYISALGKIPDCRFDAVLLNGDTLIEWIPNAFSE